MRRKGMTVKEATREWVQEMNAFPQGMISKLMEYEELDWQEITMPTKGDRVYVYSQNAEGHISKYNEEADQYLVDLDDGEEVTVEADDLSLSHYDKLPMWGTMWAFDDSADNYWLEERDGIRLMSECGFRIFESQEFGYFFGIDGAGYDFYESHWIPLYRARGFQWHDPETEKQEAAA